MFLPILLSAILPIIISFAGEHETIANVILVVTWFVFVLDFVVHVRLIPHYVKTGTGKFDLVVVLLTAPWFLIPGLGNARFLVFARLARLLRVVKVGGRRLARLGEQLGRVGLVTIGITVTCAYVAYVAEKGV